eukprot:SAG22_NODE_15112_length_356_cov_1.607004_1_plen_35_part_10
MQDGPADSMYIQEPSFAPPSEPGAPPPLDVPSYDI